MSASPSPSPSPSPSASASPPSSFTPTQGSDRVNGMDQDQARARAQAQAQDQGPVEAQGLELRLGTQTQPVDGRIDRRDDYPLDHQVPSDHTLVNESTSTSTGSTSGSGSTSTSQHSSSSSPVEGSQTQAQAYPSSTPAFDDIHQPESGNHRDGQNRDCKNRRSDHEADHHSVPIRTRINRDEEGEGYNLADTAASDDDVYLDEGKYDVDGGTQVGGQDAAIRPTKEEEEEEDRNKQSPSSIPKTEKRRQLGVNPRRTYSQEVQDNNIDLKTTTARLPNEKEDPEKNSYQQHPSDGEHANGGFLGHVHGPFHGPGSDARGTFDNRQDTIDDSYNHSEEDFDPQAEEDEAARQPFHVKMYRLFMGSLNFYRIHMLVFIFVPFFFSGIFYASNTLYHIDYIDCLFLCVSAMTVTGLATINLSTLNAGQQVILFIQMLMGSIIAVSMVMILVRQHFFRQEFKHIIDGRRKAREDAARAEQGLSPIRRLRRLSTNLHPGRKAKMENNEANIDNKEIHPRFQGIKGSLKWRDLFRHPQPDTVMNNENTEKPDLGDRTSSQSFKMPKSMDETSKKSTDGKARLKDEEKNQKTHTEQIPVPITQPPYPAQHSHHITSWFSRDQPKAKMGKLRTDMIKRVEGGGVGMINPMGWYHDSPISSGTPTEDGNDNGAAAGPAFAPSVQPGRGILENSAPATAAIDTERQQPRPILHHEDASNEAGDHPERPERRFSDPLSGYRPPPPPLNLSEVDDRMPRTKTIAFDHDENHDRTAYTSGRDTTGYYRSTHQHPLGGYMPRTGTIRSIGQTNQGLQRTATGRRSVAPGHNMGGRVLTRTPTTQSGAQFSRTLTINQKAKTSGYGGFPGAFALTRMAFSAVFPKIANTIHRTMTLPKVATSTDTVDTTNDAKSVGYISFDAVVGRNSHFHDLTKDEHDELGGVEYRALKALFWIVLLYWIGAQILAFIVAGPYLNAGGRYAYVFNPESANVIQPVNLWWYTIFNCVSAFSNTGMSLVDTSMVPFQYAYVWIVIIIILIFTGNTAFPIFLRFTIWWLSKIVPVSSRLHETLKFLLDHPRRCFVYLFPSTQTWFLVMVMVVLTLIDFVSFMVLDIGNPAIDDIPVGPRIAAGFLQSTAVRAAGFGIVALNALSPAVKVLYVIMQYISVYPIAMSIRSTNVYEERSLGIFNDIDPNEEEPSTEEGRGAVVKYLGWHARRQLAFDIWWLAGSLWIVCIIERGMLTNPENCSWFSIFSVLFELVSAYGTVGLSLGVPYNNFSLSGAFKILSKLVVIAVMIRGRHRGLPVAIDRAVMLPKGFNEAEENAFHVEADRLSRARTRRNSSMMASASGADPAGGGGGVPRTSSFFAGQTNTHARDGSFSSSSGTGNGNGSGNGNGHLGGSISPMAHTTSSDLRHTSTHLHPILSPNQSGQQIYFSEPTSMTIGEMIPPPPNSPKVNSIDHASYDRSTRRRSNSISMEPSLGTSAPTPTPITAVPPGSGYETADQSSPLPPSSSSKTFSQANSSRPLSPIIESGLSRAPTMS